MKPGTSNFQPMPKRFMVWDEETHDFVKGVNGYILNWREIANLVEPTVYDCATELDEIVQRFTIIQSTNLFDKDGKEIFEGSIVEANWGFNTGSTYLEYNMVGIVKNLNGVWCITENNSDTDGKMLCELNPEDLNILGHILSNPELVEKR